MKQDMVLAWMWAGAATFNSLIIDAHAGLISFSIAIALYISSSLKNKLEQLDKRLELIQKRLNCIEIKRGES